MVGVALEIGMEKHRCEWITVEVCLLFAQAQAFSIQGWFREFRVTKSDLYSLVNGSEPHNFHRSEVTVSVCIEVFAYSLFVQWVCGFSFCKHTGFMICV